MKELVEIILVSFGRNLGRLVVWMGLEACLAERRDLGSRRGGQDREGVKDPRQK